MDDETFLRGLFKALLGRDPEPAAAAYLRAQLAAGRSTEALITEVAASPECRQRFAASSDSFAPLGHFYSPLCDPAALAGFYRDPALAVPDDPIRGINLNAERQLAMWDAWRPMLASIDFPDQRTDGWRYFYDNPAFGPADAIVLHCMLRWARPRRYVEVGAGYSSACALDTIERHLAGQVRPIFVDPHPEVLHGLLRDGDAVWITVHAAAVQTIAPDLWESLEPNDILFVDSSHVVKTGSDVVTILFEALPRLRAGVIVHFHDVFFPFEYPRHWVLEENRSWNELYALRAFLTANPQWEILFFNDHFRRRMPRSVAEICPAYARHAGGSLWLRRIEA